MGREWVPTPTTGVEAKREMRVVAVAIIENFIVWW